MVTYLGGSILITIFALGGSIVSYNLHFNSRTTQRVIYGEALSSGKSVFNIESSGEAVSEIQNITKELQNFIYEQKI